MNCRECKHYDNIPNTRRGYCRKPSSAKYNLLTYGSSKAANKCFEKAIKPMSVNTEVIWYIYKFKKPDYCRPFICFGKVWTRDIFRTVKDLETGDKYDEDKLREGHWCYIPIYGFNERQL